jgi:hypothetical protein
MARCPQCSGYLLYEPEFMETPARLKCTACGWMVSDPKFRQEKPTYFPAASANKRIGWQLEHPGCDLYEPTSAAYQLGISESYFKNCVKSDSSAPVLMERGMIACNTPALQAWWDGKNHHR